MLPPYRTILVALLAIARSNALKGILSEETVDESPQWWIEQGLETPPPVDIIPQQPAFSETEEGAVNFSLPPTQAGVPERASSLAEAHSQPNVQSNTQSNTQPIVQDTQTPILQGTPSISAAQALKIIDAAAQKAKEIGVPSNIAITDPAGHLVSFLRMDGAVLVSIDVAQRKARTVSLFGGKFRTADLKNATSPGGPLYGIERTNDGLVFFGGGVPLKSNGVFIGSLGVSGGQVEQDVQVAGAGAAALT